MPYPVPPPPPLVHVAAVSYVDALPRPENLIAEAERQVLLPEPMSARPLASLSPSLLSSTAGPSSAVPRPVAPESTVPGLTPPGLTPSGLTAPELTAPGLTAPGLTAPGLTASGLTAPQPTAPVLPDLIAQSARAQSVLLPTSASTPDEPGIPLNVYPTASAGDADGETVDPSSLGPAVEVGLPSGGSLPGSHLGNLQRDYGLNEATALQLESDVVSRLESDEAAYEKTAVLLHDSRDILGELVDWVAQQSQEIIPGELQAPLPSSTNRPNAAPETNAIPLEDLDLGPSDEAAPEETAAVGALEVIADRQIYDQRQQAFIAEGNVALLVRGSILTADEVRVNLPNQIAIATGDVVFTRGDQVLRGDRIEYNFVREEGAVLDARGEVFIPQIAADLSGDRPIAGPSTATPQAGVDVGVSQEDILSQRLSRQQPEVQTATSTGGVTVGAGISGARGSSNQGSASGSVRQLRFEAERIDFRPGGWVASNVRLTNDPFSPPELEIRTNQATFQRLSATRSELRLKNPRLVVDQGLAIPLLRSRFIFDERQRNPLPIQFGFDEEDRDGLFAERPFEVLATPDIQFTVTPQFFIQRAFTGRDADAIELGENDTGVLNPNSYGLTSELDIAFDSLTSLEANTVLTSLDFDQNFADEDLRGLVRLRRRTPSGYTFTGEYNYRDRLFNGTLGFQTVDQSFGFIATSPTIRLGNSGVELTYQGAIQRITDDIRFERRDDLLGPILEREDNNTTLTRYQLAAELQRFFLLWSGTPLPATPDQGLRYTPTPVVPFIGFSPRVRGVAGVYSSGDTQPILTGQLSFFGQFGHFSRSAFDYLGFNLTYRRSTEGSESPFNFDLVRDREVFSGGLTAQLIGPFRAGFQTSISLSQDRGFDTSYFVEYSRRTFGLVARFNPDREIGSFNLRISDFTWAGTPRRFDAEPVEYDPQLVDPDSVDFPADRVIDAESDPAEPIDAELGEAEPVTDEPVTDEPIDLDQLDLDSPILNPLEDDLNENSAPLFER